MPIFNGKDIKSYLQADVPSSDIVNVVLEECDLELWTLEAGEGEKRGSNVAG